MIDGQSEQLKTAKKAMKALEIVNSDKQQLTECKNDLMKKLAMEDKDAEEVALSIRDMFLPKLLETEGLKADDMPNDFNNKMTDNDDNFTDDTNNDEQDEDSEFDDFNDDSEVDEDEIATIHITVPADKLKLVEQALEDALGDSDADNAMDHEEKRNTGEKDMDNKTIEARRNLRKTILAAMSDYDKDSILSVSHTPGFDYDKSEQYREEGTYDTFKGDLTDPDTKTLNFVKSKVPNYSNVVDNATMDDLGLNKSLESMKFDSGVDLPEQYELKFNAFDIPSQGNEDLFVKMPIPAEEALPLKRTINSSTKTPDDLEEELLANALRNAGVEDSDLVKLTYAEAKVLLQEIRTAEKMKEREHYSPDGKLPYNYNNPKDPDREADANDVKDNLEINLREHVGEEIDPAKSHERKGKELYSSEDQYTKMLKKMMNGEDGFTKVSDKDTTIVEPDEVIISETDREQNQEKLDKQMKAAELYKARLKTAYACATHLALAELLDVNSVDTYVETMINDNMSVPAMMRQTKMMLANAASQAERLAATNATRTVRTASAGITFNPQVGNNVDISGALDISNALKNIGWTQPSRTEVEE